MCVLHFNVNEGPHAYSKPSFSPIVMEFFFLLLLLVASMAAKVLAKSKVPPPKKNK